MQVSSKMFAVVIAAGCIVDSRSYPSGGSSQEVTGFTNLCEGAAVAPNGDIFHVKQVHDMYTDSSFLTVVSQVSNSEKPVILGKYYGKKFAEKESSADLDEQHYAALRAEARTRQAKRIEAQQELLSLQKSWLRDKRPVPAV